MALIIRALHACLMGLALGFVSLSLAAHPASLSPLPASARLPNPAGIAAQDTDLMARFDRIRQLAGGQTASLSRDEKRCGERMRSIPVQSEATAHASEMPAAIAPDGTQMADCPMASSAQDSDAVRVMPGFEAMSGMSISQTAGGPANLPLLLDPWWLLGGLLLLLAFLGLIARSIAGMDRAARRSG